MKASSRTLLSVVLATIQAGPWVSSARADEMNAGGAATVPTVAPSPRIMARSASTGSPWVTPSPVVSARPLARPRATPSPVVSASPLVVPRTKPVTPPVAASAKAAAVPSVLSPESAPVLVHHSLPTNPDPCPLFLVGFDRENKVLSATDLVRSATDCGIPDLFYRGQLYPARSRPGLLEVSGFAQVVVSCQELFSSNQDLLGFSKEFKTSMLQPGAPVSFRVRASLMDYISNLIRRDGGVWLIGDATVSGCHPERVNDPNSPGAAETSGKKSTSKVRTYRNHPPDELGEYSEFEADSGRTRRTPASRSGDGSNDGPGQSGIEYFPSGGPANGSEIPRPPEQIQF